VTAQQNIEFGEGQSGVFGKPGEGPASAPLAGVRLMVVPAMPAGGGGGGFGGLGGGGFGGLGGSMKPIPVMAALAAA
jgi:hypothetical protein